jgi:hypothetical protein
MAGWFNRSVLLCFVAKDVPENKSKAKTGEQNVRIDFFTEFDWFCKNNSINYRISNLKMIRIT